MADTRDRLGHFLPAEEPTPELAKKRLYGDRQDLIHGVIYSTSGAGAEVEIWLEANCAGKWSLELEAMDVTLKRKSFRAMFELAADKKAFVLMLAGQGARRGRA